jgi:hypothetical protein
LKANGQRQERTRLGELEAEATARVIETLPCVDRTEGAGRFENMVGTRRRDEKKERGREKGNGWRKGGRYRENVGERKGKE